MSFSSVTNVAQACNKIRSSHTLKFKIKVIYLTNKIFKQKSDDGSAVSSVCVSVSSGMRWRAHSGRTAPPGVWLLPSSGARCLSDDHHDSCRATQEIRRCELSQLLLWKSPEACDILQPSMRMSVYVPLYEAAEPLFTLFMITWSVALHAVHLKYCWVVSSSAATRWSCESTESQCGEAVRLWDDEL